MHNWRFFRAGGFDQVALDHGEDFANLEQLDQKLWVALGCPIAGLEFDQDTLQLMDTDADGRVRASELLAAARWAIDKLNSADELLTPGADLPLAAINPATGSAIALAARRVLQELGRSPDPAIDLASASAAAELLAAKPLNGDGVVVSRSTDDAGMQALIQTMLDCGYGSADRCGENGIGSDGADAFFAAVDAAIAWHAESEQDTGMLFPAGAATAAAAAAVAAVRAKLDDHFARTRLAQLDARAAAALNRDDSAWLALAALDLGNNAEAIRAFPLAHVGTTAILYFDEPLNPAWSGAIKQLRSDAIRPLLGEQESLTETDWTALLARLRPWMDWQARKPAGPVAELGTETLRSLHDTDRRAGLRALIDADRAQGEAYDNLADLVKLIRYRRDLARLCRNFVNFADFYSADCPAIFQFGTLYLDQRSCTLCLPVHDAARHATLAGMAGVYLAYCDCVRQGEGQKMQIVAAFTGGDSNNLLVGRNGVFYDRQGRDWDATITRIVDNPISVRQAFWSPYKKLSRFVEEQVAKRAAAADAAGGQKLQTTVVTVPVASATADPAKPAPKKVDVGTVAAIGVALGSIGTAFGYFLRTVASIKSWQLPLLLIGVMLLISGPAMIMAYLKLRRRNLAPLLDANGWAVNARALINVPFGSSLTGVAVLPKGSTHAAADRFAQQASHWPRIIALLFVVWWVYAFLSDQGYL